MLFANLLAETSADAVRSGIGLGSAIAIVCSWDRNRSIIFAIIAGILSWFYVIYFALTRQPGDRIA